jgi:hypothetical protein
MHFKWINVTVVHREKNTTVSKVIKHPKFVMSMPSIYDIAILKLTTPIKTTDVFVCLPSNDLDRFVGINVKASGWGKESDEEKGPSKVKEKSSFNSSQDLKMIEFVFKKHTHLKLVWFQNFGHNSFAKN